MLITIACPARALDNTPEITNSSRLVDLAFDFDHKLSDLDTTDSSPQNLSPSQVLGSMLDLDSNLSHTNDLTEHLGNNGHSPEKAPTFEFTINPNFSLPPHERLAASTFGASAQIEALFLLVFEFHPEILGIKHFLAPLNTVSDVPWFLRPSAANKQGRTAGWKESNTLYTGVITYLN